jgi:hypothetical protein
VDIYLRLHTLATWRRIQRSKLRGKQYENKGSSKCDDDERNIWRGSPKELDASAIAVRAGRMNVPPSSRHGPRCGSSTTGRVEVAQLFLFRDLFQLLILVTGKFEMARNG